MNNKLKMSYNHAHRIEDIWADCRIEEDIGKLDYCHLTKDQIINPNLEDVPDDLVDDGNVIDFVYESRKLIIPLFLLSNGPKRRWFP